MMKWLRICSITACMSLELVSFAPTAHGQGAVLTREGYPLKGITRRDTRIYAKPEESAETRPHKQFSFVYILPPEGGTGTPDAKDPTTLTVNGFYLVAVGNALSQKLGWIPQDDIELWSHIQALGFTPQANRELVPFFDVKSDVGLFLTLDAAAQSLEDDVTEDEVPAGVLREYLGTAADDADVASDVATWVAGRDSLPLKDAVAFLRDRTRVMLDYQEPRYGMGNLILMPLLDVREKSLELGMEKQDLYEVSFLSGPVENLPPRPDETGRPIASDGPSPDDLLAAATKAASLDLVFVVDTTTSMRDPIDQVRKSIEAVSSKLKDNPSVVNLRLGFVAYQDHGVSGLKAAEIKCNLDQGEKLDDFIEVVRGINVASVGSEDWPEDVWAGVDLALGEGLKWNTAAGALPIVCIVADASAHEPGHRGASTNNTAKTLLEKAKPSSTSEGELNPRTFVVQHILNPEADFDHAVARKQFLSITEESGGSGAYFSSPVNEDFATELAGYIESVLDAVEELPARALRKSGTAKAEELGKLADEGELAKIDVSHVLQRLSAELPPGYSADDVFFSKAFASQFDPGYSTQFIPYIFVSRGSLTSFRILIEILIQSLSGMSPDAGIEVDEVVSDLQRAVVGLNIGTDITEELEMGQLAMMTVGIPMQTPVMTRRLMDIKQMTQGEWENWMRDLDQIVNKLNAQLDNPSLWGTLHASATPEFEHAFIKVTDLP